MTVKVVFNSRIPQFLVDVETRVGRGLARTGANGRGVARAGTPVLTGYAKRSVHTVTVDSAGTFVDGDTADGNGNPTPPYPRRPIPTTFVGSNTEPRIDHFTGPGGYYLGLELGIFSRKGSGMLMAALTAMINVCENYIGQEMRRP